MFNIIIPISISIFIAIILLIAKMFETKIDKRKIYAILAIVCLVITFILYILLRHSGLIENTSDSVIDVNFSNYNGIKEKEIFLNSDDNELNLNGTIKIKNGEVELYVKVKDTNKILYSKEFTSKENRNINIDIDDLEENKDLMLVLEVKNVEEMKLQLTSKQKLVRDKEVPKA